MVSLIIQFSKYAIIILMAIYTMQSYIVFSKKDEDDKEFLFLRQNLMMFMIHFIAFVIMYLEMEESELVFFYGSQFIYLAATLVFFRNLYPRASKLVVNHMCMLITIGFIMVTRLSYEQSVDQFKIVAASTAVALIVPLIIRKMHVLTRWTWLYAAIGIGLLAAVAVAAPEVNGANLGFTVGGISIQPSEFVKIIFVFAVAGMLAKAKNFRDIVVATAVAAIHVLILVYSTDLGSALIFFATYLVMLYVATRNCLYVFAGLGAGSVAAVAAYHLFAHVRVRVQVWQNPFLDYSGSGYQIAQSLFAIAAGGWFGTGLFQGTPDAIPYAGEDFMFAAIAEELGGIFAICLILVCMSCYIMFVNIAMRLSNRFYRLVALGLGTMYAVQVFLTVGGAMKFIPMTGVTLPLVSHGGSSMLSTVLMFSIIQGLYILREDEEDQIEKIRERELESRRYY
ncbi:MAG: FtsW/RodA/SpoVE family cell cycle protein [Eubacteriales bacterium]|nr:FtsW/RodA/SpoVE family cell cycle protein [Eubacteriales bacterium]